MRAIAHLPARGRIFGAVLLALACMGSSLAVPAAKAAGESPLVYDPLLSLTGGCSTSTIDPVPDPGCPGGTHPPSAFSAPMAVTTDPYGNRYVANRTTTLGSGEIDVFTPGGQFITRIPTYLPGNLALDSEGNLYVALAASGVIGRFSPTGVYEPASGKIEYEPTPTTVASGFVGIPVLALNPLNDHLFIFSSGAVEEFSSAATGNEPLPEFGAGLHSNSPSLAVDAQRGRIYFANEPFSGSPEVVVLDLDPPHALLFSFDGSELPGGKFTYPPRLAVDEETGTVFAYDLEVPKAIREFTPGGEYASTLSFGFEPGNISGSKISFDNGPFSPSRGYLFVASHPTGTGHLFAFGPPPDENPPQVESVSVAGVTQGDAELRATVNPEGLATHYTFEYTTEQRFALEGFAGAASAGGQLASGDNGVDVSATATGLSPGTAYRIRLIATNAKGEDEGEASFTTFLQPDPSPPCPNGALRSGSSAPLPDCRAYELVTPSNTNGHLPLGPDPSEVPSPQASPAGDRVSFRVEGGAIPGFGGTGSYLSGDPYLSTRFDDGWRTVSSGPDGPEASVIVTGGSSPDQEHSFFYTEGDGSLLVGGQNSSYLRYPDGRYELIGRGSMATDPAAQGVLISEDGDHVVFQSSFNTAEYPAIQLEPDAPLGGTRAVYDRTADEVTHVVSLLPGEVTPAAGEDAGYQGASPDAEGIAFRIGSKLYLRYRNERTFEIGENVAFAGVSAGGGRVFYLEGGDLRAFDVATEAVIDFTTSGDATPVNVSADGSTAYFVSPGVLTSEPNPIGDTAQSGEQNLYLSREGQIGFVGTVTQRDVEGTDTGAGHLVEGLGLWLFGLAGGSPAADPSRTTPDGEVLLFEARAQLTAADGGGLAQVYRYDAAANALDCLSCSPTGAPNSGSSSLQSINADFKGGTPEPTSAATLVGNLREDGRRVFFQSDEKLVASDGDGHQDVYEWEAEGVGSCERPGGCTYLISSGQSARDDYLYATSISGDDVFVQTADLLLPSLDPDETPSIYDARVGGGFPLASQPGECLGEACQPAAFAPNDATPASSSFSGWGNVTPRSTRPCPKGKRKAHRGRPRCVPVRKRHAHRSHHKRGAHR